MKDCERLCEEGGVKGSCCGRTAGASKTVAEEDRSDQLRAGGELAWEYRREEVLLEGPPRTSLGSLGKTCIKDRALTAKRLRTEGVIPVVRADEVGEARKVEKICSGDSVTSFSRGVKPSCDGAGPSEHRSGKARTLALNPNPKPVRLGKKGVGWSQTTQGCRTYKEALMVPQPKHTAPHPLLLLA